MADDETLNERDLEVIDAVLRATVEGPFYPDWEFPALMGLTRDDVRVVREHWPWSPPYPGTLNASVEGALVSLLDSPHGHWDAWAAYCTADEREVREVLEHWRRYVHTTEERDRRLEEAGEPPWGDVLLHTTDVTYWTPVPAVAGLPLIRVVAEVHQGPFYVESYRGHGRWNVDDVAIGLIGGPVDGPPQSVCITPHEAAAVMREVDAGMPGVN